ncbi:MAG TPA: LpxD N-terminal domain-containing protein, partial [Pirellulales bacterium]|nr:LpxD N-terminal domain-containing protein [Pirellulales bacterium]
MLTTLATLAKLVGGRLVGPGNGALEIDGTATLDEAEPGHISFLDSAERAHRLSSCRASALVVPADFEPERWPAIQVADVHRSFAAIVRHFRPQQRSQRVGVGPLAFVSSTARIGENVDIHPGATI